MRIRAELHGEIVVVVRHVVEAHEVRDAGRGHRCLEARRPRDEPVGELAAVAAAFDAKARRIDPRILRDHRVDRRQHILGFLPS